LWQKAGMKGHCRANKFRKAAVSATWDWKETVNQKNNDLANLMGHTKSRAGKLLPQTMSKVKPVKANTSSSEHICLKQ